jgi:hypothetical protein
MHSGNCTTCCWTGSDIQHTHHQEKAQSPGELCDDHARIEGPDAPLTSCAFPPREITDSLCHGGGGQEVKGVLDVI